MRVSANARSRLIGATPKVNALSPVVAVQQIDMIAVKNHGQGHVCSDAHEWGSAVGRTYHAAATLASERPPCRFSD